MKPDKQPLVEGCASMGIDLHEDQIAAFESYLSLLLEWNKKINLTAIREPKEIQIYHFLDSLSALKLDIIKKNSSLLDMGTGAGLPGIPIKIICPQISLVLLDSVNKKVRFVETVIEQLKLDKCTAVHARAEEMAREPGKREAFDVVVSRAVAEMRVLSEYCLPFVKQGGYFLAYKGPGADEELKDAQNALKILGGEWVETRDIKVPFSDKTHKIIVIKKKSKTPKQYPRSAGKPKKFPL